MPTQRPGSVASKRDSSRRPGKRGGRGTGAGRSPSPAPERPTPLRPRGLWVVALGVLVATAVVVAVVLYDRGETDPLADRVAELQAQEDARNTELVGELTEQATAAHADLLPVLDGLHTVLPVDGAPDGSAGEPAGPAAVEDWRSAVDGAVATFGDPPSGSTEVNMARNGLLLGIELLGSSLTAYESALAADAGDPQRARLEALASDLRMQAVQAWSVAATQLDVLNIDAGHGHVHIHLPVRPGEEVDPHGDA